MFEKDVIVDDNPTRKQLVKITNDLFKESWVRGYSYPKSTATLMKSINIEKSLPYVNDKQALVKYILYFTQISIEMNSFDSNRLPEHIYKEIDYWNSERGGYCIYISALLYGILLRNKVIDERNISYYQGYYDFKTSKGEEFTIARMIFGERQIGIHAWLTIKDCLVDITADQNKPVFDFEFDNIPIIFGEFPAGYNLYGFKEKQETLEKYWKMFAEYRNMSVDEWFTMHEIACIETELKTRGEYI